MRDPARTALAALAALALGLVMAAPATAQTDDTDTGVQALPFTDDAAPAADAPDPPSSTVTRMADWAVASGDNQDRPYIIVDKPSAEVFVYDAGGALLGSAPALLGSAMGDDAAPGVGDLELADIPADERTTEAGRFIAHLGPAKGMRSVLWVDFDTALSLHPVITSNPREQRLQRLRSPSPDDRRITHGCINVPARFYRDVVHKAFAGSEGVVYILPDTKSVEEVFPDFGLQAAADGPKPRHRRRAHDRDASSEALATLGVPF